MMLLYLAKGILMERRNPTRYDISPGFRRLLALLSRAGFPPEFSSDNFSVHPMQRVQRCCLPAAVIPKETP